MLFDSQDKGDEETEIVRPPLFKKNVLIEQPDFFKDFLLNAWLEYVDDAEIKAPEEGSELQTSMEKLEELLEGLRLNAIKQLETDYQELLEGISTGKLMITNKSTGYDPLLPKETSLSDFYLLKIKYSSFGSHIIIEPALPSVGDQEKDNFLLAKLAESKKSDLITTLDLPIFQFKKENLKDFSVYGTPLIKNIANTFTDNALTLIKSGADLNKYAAQFGNNPLLLAITKGWNHIDNDEMVSHLEIKQRSQKPIIEALLAGDADVNLVHLKNGMSALHIACLRGDDPELIQLLLNHGAKISIDLMGRTPHQLLTYDYDSAKKILSQLLDNTIFGDPPLAENQSLVATLPTKREREANIQKIKEIFSHQAKASVSRSVK